MSQAGVASSSGGGGGAVTANISPYIVGATKSDFTTIGAAITAAAAAGASSTNQINIYIKPKPGVATYVENITLTDGINLVGLCPYVDEFNDQNTLGSPSVVITGTLTCSGEVSVSNIRFDSNKVIIANSAFLSFIKVMGCRFSISGNQPFITNNSGLGATMILDNCYASYGSGSGTFLSNPINVLNLYTYDCQFDGSTNTSSIAGSTTFQFSRSSFFNLALTYPGSLLSFNCYDCIFITLSIIDNGINTFRFFNCPQMSTVNITGTSGEVLLDNCATSGVPTITSVGPIYVNCYDLFNRNYYNRGPGFSGSFPFSGSEVHSFTNNLQTTDATVSTLASVTLNASETITVFGTIAAAKSDHTDSCGGNFNITVRRAAAGAPVTVGAVIVNVNSTSTATFTADNDGSSLVRIRVTGIAATTYNWVTNYFYQKVLTSA